MQQNNGIEVGYTETTRAAGTGDAKQSRFIAAQHVRFLAVTIEDQTDIRNDLVHEREYLLHPCEKTLRLTDNLFVFHDLLSDTGMILLRQAPHPEKGSEKGSALDNL